MVRSRTTVKPGLLLQPYVVAQLGGALVERAIEGTDLTASEFAVTSLVGLQGDATPSELSRDLGLAATTLSAMIERLVRKGHLRRVRHPEDGRSYLLALTAKGRAANARAGRRMRELEAELGAQLGRDEEEILEAMRALESAMRRALEPERRRARSAGPSVPLGEWEVGSPGIGSHRSLL
jgi:DNA-binding MarR family transcriptional regulator